MAILIDILAAGAVDASGSVLAAGKAYVYTRGTTTKKDVFQDEALMVPHSNPITLDAAGKAEAYTDSPVRIVLETSAGATVADYDRVGETVPLSGDVTVGTDSDNFLQINSLIQNDLLPKTHNTYDLGSDAIQWAEVRAVNTYTSGAMTVTGSGVHNCNAAFANHIWDTYTRPTGSTVLARGVAISGSSGAFSDASGSYTDITNLSVSLVVTSRPVLVGLMPDGSGSDSYILEGSGTGSIRFTREGTGIADILYGNENQSPAGFLFIDDPGAGTYEYKAQIYNQGSGTSLCYYVKMYAFEL